MSKLKAKRAPASIYVLSSGPGWNYDPSDVFQSLAAAKLEQVYAKEIYDEKLTLHHYKLQPKAKR